MCEEHRIHTQKKKSDVNDTKSTFRPKKSYYKKLVPG
jgi:hypothetical protein